MAKPDFRAAASQRLAQEEKLSDSVLSLLKPEGEQHDRAVRQIAVDRITPNPKQPRIAADPAALDDLTASIREHGVLQPILVRPLERGRYEIVAGERRWRAVTALALALIPAIIEEMSDEQAIEIAVIENLQRENLSPLDEAAIFARMTSELGYSIRKLANKLGKDKGYIENRLRLVAAPADVRALVAERSDTISHAYELMKIDDPARRAELAAQIARGELSLARLRRLSVERASTQASAHQQWLLPQLQPQLRLPLIHQHQPRRRSLRQLLKRRRSPAPHSVRRSLRQATQVSPPHASHSVTPLKSSPPSCMRLIAQTALSS